MTYLSRQEAFTNGLNLDQEQTIEAVFKLAANEAHV